MALTPYTAITKPTVGNGVSKADEGDPMVDNFTRLHTLEDQAIWIPLNGATALVAGDKAYWRVPTKFNGGTLVGVAAACKVASTSGAVVLTVKNGATAMLSTNLTIDETETDTNTSSAAAVIDTAHDDLTNDGAAAADLLEFSVVSPGASVTYCGIEITVRPAA
jgi:hypothetical protein